MSKSLAILSIEPLGFQWKTADPFLFCVHHKDNYPLGNDDMGPMASLKGRNIGQDFELKDGWRMYHGSKIPGFPEHPHRGFETVTVVRQGMVDHADSLGASGRYGAGDVQWMTAGKGIQHSEMFPLLNREKENTLELFQIWLNLPAKNKFVKPHFKMLWNDKVSIYTSQDDKGKCTRIEVIAGSIDKVKAPSPPPDSWAGDSNNHVAIWTIKIDAHGEWALPPAEKGINRTLYFYKGSGIEVEGQPVEPYHAVVLKPDEAVSLVNGKEEGRLLLLQGRPINEPVAQYGPFVMNTQEEIEQAFTDFRKAQFGGWPWSRNDMVHSRRKDRFAKHANGKEEFPSGK